MWKYKDITREEFEKRKDFVEQILTKLGAETINDSCMNKVSCIGQDFSDSIISNRTIYQYKNEYFRVGEVLFSNKPFIVIEWTEGLEYALNNIMEDTEPFPYDLSDGEIFREVKRLLIG